MTYIIERASAQTFLAGHVRTLLQSPRRAHPHPHASLAKKNLVPRYSMWPIRIRRPTLALLLYRCPMPNLSTWKGKDPDDLAGPRWRRCRWRRH
jgi:hypothetical protein